MQKEYPRVLYAQASNSVEVQNMGWLQVNHENKKLIGKLSIINHVEKREKYFAKPRR